MESEILVDVKNIKKSFGAIKAVDDISFQVRRGDIFGFLGPNGAGKSTAMKIITCFLEQDAGSVHVAGHDTLTESLAVRQKIGYLPESAPAYGEMTVTGFLQFVAEARNVADSAAAIARVVEMTGLERVVHQTVETLSKGFKRRVGLAQALIHDPEVLILDEPTDGLDPNQKALVQDLINRIARNKAIILSTHILDEVERVCNRALIISRGQMLVDSTPRELMGRAGNHNVIRLVLREPDKALADKISAQNWCERLVRQTETEWEIVPKDRANHLNQVMAMLEGREIESIAVLEGRLEELFREITEGVCA
ncbi:ABC transporter ATP-binding protein [Acanthopleuribacter pedis]|uniref:ATP-binding cassette domain-containing protein n=1 Tax=Acanthopleuribacter pedis TaxID=442870 RepID=A0A8J7Q2E1_9BACT|nr:ATP-binding cassette domain-containing protein [Acanthopleuribacter pedis]MBO1317007.1 ATP-binding cassette domain-containing protein [Acanthopleuribacter pedis]